MHNAVFAGLRGKGFLEGFWLHKYKVQLVALG